MADDWSRDYWSRMIRRVDDWSLGLSIAGLLGHHFLCVKSVCCYVDLSVADVRCLTVHRRKENTKDSQISRLVYVATNSPGTNNSHDQ